MRFLQIQSQARLQLTLFIGLYSGEKSYEAFLRSEWRGASADMLNSAQAYQQDQWVSMSPKEKVVRWARNNRFKIVLGS